jgi:glycosyltransferase involved in cell wall biosynthesis
MMSWRPLRDISAPVRVIHLNVDECSAKRREAIAAPYFLILWRGDRPIAQFSAFCSSDPPLDWRMVEHACETPTAAPTSQTSRSSISLVICTRDRPQDLDRCLASLPSQNRPPDQVVVVDNASSTEETRRVVERHGAVYVREDRPGLDIARNRGAAASSGDIVAYTDDDTILHPSWLRRIEDAFDTKEIWAVTGLVLPAELESEAQCVFEKVWSFGRGFLRRDFGPRFYSDTRKRSSPTWTIGAGANMAFRREVFDKIGGFDERLDAGAAGCSGDSEFWNRILHAGGVCRYEPGAVVHHFHRRTMEGLRVQIRAYIRGTAAALLVQHERTGEWGNLHRVLSLPRHFVKQGLRRLAGGRTAYTCLWLEELRGFVEGISYYGTAPRTSTSPGYFSSPTGPVDSDPKLNVDSDHAMHRNVG